MTSSNFDELTRALASSTSRRQTIKAIFASTLGGVLAFGGLGTALAAPLPCGKTGDHCTQNNQCCNYTCDVNTSKCSCRGKGFDCTKSENCCSGKCLSNGKCQ